MSVGQPPALNLLRFLDEGFYRRALADWDWLPVAGKRPFASSLFGDLFLDDETGAVWHLDVLEGDLSQVFASRQEMRDALDTDEGQDRYLLGGLALGAQHRLGVTAGEDQALAWTVPPVLGGSLEPENLYAMDFQVWLSIAGQLHRQVKDMAPGTVVTGFAMADEAPASISPKKKGRWFG